MTAEAPLARVLVTGSKGQLGTAFVEALSSEHLVRGVDVEELDLTASSGVRGVVREYRPTLILNCAAFTDVDGAERQPLVAYRANAEVVWTLATLAGELDALLVHYSSDFVHDGRLGRPYTELDEPSPQSVYGATKLAGERFAATAERSYVLRLSSLYGGHRRRTTIDWIVGQARSGQRVTAFADRTVSPSYVPDVVDTTLRLIGNSAPFGIYNCSSPDWCTWADLAAYVLTSCGRPDLLEPVPSVDAPGRAVRPRNCAMSSAKIRAAGVTPRRWADALDDYLARLSVESTAAGGTTAPADP